MKCRLAIFLWRTAGWITCRHSASLAEAKTTQSELYRVCDGLRWLGFWIIKLTQPKANRSPTLKLKPTSIKALTLAILCVSWVDHMQVVLCMSWPVTGWLSASWSVNYNTIPYHTITNHINPIPSTSVLNLVF